jgi:hypothetical protein
MPAIRNLARKRVEGQIKVTNIPNLSTVDWHWLRHSAIRDQLVKLARGDTDIRGSLDTGEASARLR